MRQYLDAVREILNHGTRKENRTSVDTLSTFNINYEIDLKEGFPLLTTKEISWKNIVVELLWFLAGRRDVGFLQKHGCKFWDAWADKRGNAPMAYGPAWRRFPVHGTIDSSDMAIDGDPCCAYNDQIRWVLEELKRNPMSRRLVVSAWSPGDAQYSKLPPCHCMFIFNVQHDRDGKPRLCLHLTQRSCDIALGVPYNIASYALLLSLFSRFSSIEPGVFAHTLVDAHVYTSKPDGSMAEYDHVPGLKTQLARPPMALPRLKIHDSIKTLDDIKELTEADTATIMSKFELVGYNPWPAISFKVAV